MIGYPSDSLASCSIYKNLIHSFILHYLTFKKLQKALIRLKFNKLMVLNVMCYFLRHGVYATVNLKSSSPISEQFAYLAKSYKSMVFAYVVPETCFAV